MDVLDGEALLHELVVNAVVSCLHPYATGIGTNTLPSDPAREITLKKLFKKGVKQTMSAFSIQLQLLKGKLWSLKFLLLPDTPHP